MNNTIHEFRDIQSSLYNSLKYLDLSFNRLTKIQGKIKYISSEKYIFLNILFSIMIITSQLITTYLSSLIKSEYISRQPETTRVKVIGKQYKSN